jgi:hypothetical protein
MRKPQGFQEWKVPVGTLFVREDENGQWVILASEPDVKIDNKHRDGRPHMHVGNWDSTDRRDLRASLSMAEAASAIHRQLKKNGYLDLDALEVELS